ncbi:MAG: hypothetical protein AVDCRST_MAG27-2326, partial [uncultured Craurococcus sp.]
DRDELALLAHLQRPLRGGTHRDADPSPPLRRLCAARPCAARPYPPVRLDGAGLERGRPSGFHGLPDHGDRAMAAVGPRL